MRSMDVNGRLWEAARQGDVQRVKVCLREGGDPNHLRVLEGDYKQSMFHIAALNGHKEVMRVLMEGGGDVDTCDSDGEAAWGLMAR